MAELVALTGEPLALDLINTAANTPQGPIDFLATPAHLGTWLACQADRFPNLAAIETTGLTTPDLSVIHAVRDHARAAIEAARHGEPPPTPSIDGLNAALRAAPGTRALGWHGGALRSVVQRSGDPAPRLAAELAEATADLLTSSTVTTVRQCDADFCVLLFVPTQPRRRWCSPTICGNRARVARHYRRHRAEHRSGTARLSTPANG